MSLGPIKLSNQDKNEKKNGIIIKTTTLLQCQIDLALLLIGDTIYSEDNEY